MTLIGAASPGFLRRNLRYQQDYSQFQVITPAEAEQAAFLAPGGCDFAADPTIPADRQPIYWTPDAAPSVLQLISNTAELLTSGLPARKLLAAAALQVAADGLYAVWSLGVGEVQGVFEEPVSAEAFAVVMPLDAALELRALTVIRLWRLLNRLAPGPEPAPLSAARRARLVQMLRVLDARRDGASLRDVAEALFRQRIASRAWQGSSLHARTKRLVQGGLAMARGGYRDLLDPLARRRKRRGYENPTP